MPTALPLEMGASHTRWVMGYECVKSVGGNGICNPANHGATRVGNSPGLILASISRPHPVNFRAKNRGGTGEEFYGCGVGVGRREGGGPNWKGGEQCRGACQ